MHFDCILQEFGCILTENASKWPQMKQNWKARKKASVLFLGFYVLFALNYLFDRDHENFRPHLFWAEWLVRPDSFRHVLIRQA